MTDKSFAVFSVEDDEDSVLFDSEYAAQRWAEMLGIPTSKILFRNVLSYGGSSWRLRSFFVGMLYLIKPYQALSNT
jgi:hypothetical protein